jgi:hypothetical protein
MHADFKASFDFSDTHLLLRGAGIDDRRFLKPYEACSRLSLFQPASQETED